MNIRKFFGLCEHKWVIIQEQCIYDNEKDKRPYKTKIVLQCEKCGNIKIK